MNYNNIIYDGTSHYFSHKLHVFTRIRHFPHAEGMLRNDTQWHTTILFR